MCIASSRRSRCGIATHTEAAAAACPTLQTKTVTTHVLRHTAAMRLLHAGLDTSVIALWLGHEQVETTQIYLHADMTLKEHGGRHSAPYSAVPRRSATVRAAFHSPGAPSATISTGARSPRAARSRPKASQFS